MSAKHSSTSFAGSSIYQTSLLRSARGFLEDLDPADIPMDVPVERVRSRREVEHLRRRNREGKTEEKRLLSIVRGEQFKRAVSDKALEVEAGRVNVWERKYGLLEAEIALERSTRELKALREEEFKQRAM